MGLKTKDITLSIGRDAGKKLRITELPVQQADRWATRVLLIIAGGDIDVSSINMATLGNLKVDPIGGMLELIRLGWSTLQRLSTHEDRALELLNELIECASVVTSKGDTRPLQIEDDIQEFASLSVIRFEAFTLYSSTLKEGLIQLLESRKG